MLYCSYIQSSAGLVPLGLNYGLHSCKRRFWRIIQSMRDCVCFRAIFYAITDPYCIWLLHSDSLLECLGDSYCGSLKRERFHKESKVKPENWHSWECKTHFQLSWFAGLVYHVWLNVWVHSQQRATETVSGSAGGRVLSRDRTDLIECSRVPHMLCEVKQSNYI